MFLQNNPDYKLIECYRHSLITNPNPFRRAGWDFLYMGKMRHSFRGRRWKGINSLWEGIARTLKNRAFSSHRVSRYVRHEVLRKDSRVNRAGHDPTLKEGGYGWAAHCTQVSCGSLWRWPSCSIMIHCPGHGPSGNQSVAGCGGHQLCPGGKSRGAV